MIDADKLGIDPAELAEIQQQSELRRAQQQDWTRADARWQEEQQRDERGFPEHSKGHAPRDEHDDAPQPGDATGIVPEYVDTLSPEVRKMIDAYSRMA